MPAEPLRLHLGCGYGRMEGWVNCDLVANPNVDAAFDVQKDWPFGDNTAGAIYASHLLEHLRDPLNFFREAWRVLQPNAPMLLRLPHGGHELAWVDLTHIRPWFPASFCVLQPGYEQAVGNPQHGVWRWPFGIEAVDLRISGAWARPMRYWPLRKRLLAWGTHIQNFVEELWVHAFALKTPEAVAMYRAAQSPNAVRVRWAMYRHQFERRNLREGEAPALAVFGDDTALNGFSTWR